MLVDLNDVDPTEPTLPEGFAWFPWNNLQTSAYARLFHESFRDDVDGRVFPTYRQLAACERLAGATVSSRSFAPEASWLVGRRVFEGGACRVEYAGAIQSVRGRRFCGSIQNVGVAPRFRGLGLGRALVLQALDGFRRAGRTKISLEATAENVVALRMYLALGFRILTATFQETLIDFD